MTLDGFVARFAEELDDTPAELVTATSEYKRFEEWSSLVALSIIFMVDDEYDKSITGADLRNCTTIEELYNLVENK